MPITIDRVAISARLMTGMIITDIQLIFGVFMIAGGFSNCSWR